MLSRPLRRPGPTPRSRPRVFFIALVAVVLGSAAATIIELWADGPERFEAPVARRVSRKMLAFLERSPEGREAATQIAALVAEAEARLLASKARAAWRAGGGPVTQAWDRALGDGWRALRAAALSRERERTRWQELETQAEAAMARAGELLHADRLAASQSGAYAGAGLALDQGRRLAARGEHAAANRAAEEALALAEAVEAASLALRRRFEDPAALEVWRSWFDEGIASSRRSGGTVLIIDKLERRLDVYRRGTRTASFDAELGVQGLRRKLHAGDRATPEGRYRVVQLKKAPATRYHKALLLDYPTGEDLRRLEEARRQGSVPPGTPAGGLIEIHGGGGQGRDWTDGCVALADDDMDRLFRYVAKGTPVIIVGTLAGEAVDE